MGFHLTLFLALYIPQIVVVSYFNKKNIQNTGKDKGSNNTASAVQAFIFGLFTTICCPPILMEQYSLGGGNTFETDVIMHVAMAFFASHVTFVLVSKKFSSELLHHLICMLTLVYSLVTQTFGQDLLLTIFLGEITFVLYIKILAKNMGNLELEYLSETIFTFMLVPLRLIVFPVYLFFFASQPEAALIPTTLAGAYVLLGFWFTYHVVKKWNKRRSDLNVKLA